jgi:hypothetical protein
MTVGRDDDGFLSRWSRRKAGARRELPPEPAVAEGPGSEAPGAAAEPEPALTEAEIAALPPIETADADALKAYLRKGVPAALRTLAMRRMWTLTPAIRDYVDPALDYAWDWNVPGAAPWSALSPGDDPRAMVERIMARATRPEPEPEPQAEAGSDPAVTPTAEIAAPPPVAEAEAGALRHDGQPPETAATVSQDNAPGGAGSPRRRRHGGAVPT